MSEEKEDDFKAFSSIQRFKGGLHVVITEKIHGSNAQIYIEELPDGTHRVRAGSRNRWLSIVDDNYGFCRWVTENEEELITKLGPGRHFGEWYGAGINSGYGLRTRRLALFDVLWHRDHVLPEGVDLVPLIYNGPYTAGIVEECTEKIKSGGSKLVPGFMNPEGVVAHFPAYAFSLKSVLDPEETPWRQGDGLKQVTQRVTREELLEHVAMYLQPIRLDKLISRDERYIRDYPTTMPDLVRDYLTDLESDTAIGDMDAKPLRKAIFPWIRMMIDQHFLKSS